MTVFVFDWSALNSLGIHTTVWALRFFVDWFLKDRVPKRAAAHGELFLIFWANCFHAVRYIFCIHEYLHKLLKKSPSEFYVVL